MIREIRFGGILCALHIAHDSNVVGTMPVTGVDFPLQLLLIERPAGSHFDKHAHQKVVRSTTALQESLVVIEGHVRVSVCTRDGTEVENVEVKTGECFFLVEGGFSIDVLVPTRMYEFKNGPHHDDKIML